MSDPVQVVPTAMAVPRVTPVRHEPQIEPPRKSQADNRSSNERRDSEREAAVAGLYERRLSITHDEKLRTYIYRSIEEDSGDVIWQYPAEEMLRRAQFLRHFEEQQREERARNVDERA